MPSTAIATFPSEFPLRVVPEDARITLLEAELFDLLHHKITEFSAWLFRVFSSPQTTIEVSPAWLLFLFPPIAELWAFVVFLRDPTLWTLGLLSVAFMITTPPTPRVPPQEFMIQTFGLFLPSVVFSLKCTSWMFWTAVNLSVWILRVLFELAIAQKQPPAKRRSPEATSVLLISVFSILFERLRSKQKSFQD